MVVEKVVYKLININKSNHDEHFPTLTWQKAKKAGLFGQKAKKAMRKKPFCLGLSREKAKKAKKANSFFGKKPKSSYP